MTDLHVCKCYIACINRAPLHGSILSPKSLAITAHTTCFSDLQGSLHFIHLSYHISIETFLSFKIFLTSTIYVPVLTTLSEKAINENLKLLKTSAVMEWLQIQHFLVPPWRSKGTKIKSYDHKLKIAAATILIYEKVHLITNYFMNVLLLSIICK